MSRITLFKVSMGGQENTDDITAAPGFSANEFITQENFPIVPATTRWEDVIEIIPVGGKTLKEGLSMLEDKGLLRPTHEHGIRFAQQHWRTNVFPTKQYVVFPHEVWRHPDKGDCILYFYCHGIIRDLELNFPTWKFSAFTDLAGVQPCK